MAVKDFLKQKYSEAKQSYKESSARNKELRELEKKELFEARKKEKVKYAQQKASYEREQRVKSFKSGGFFGSVSSFSSGYSKPQSFSTKRYKRYKSGKKQSLRYKRYKSGKKQSLPRSSVNDIVKMI